MTPSTPWTPPSTLSEKIKRFLVPAKSELSRIVARELDHGEPELALLSSLLDPKRAALDVGANRGIWASVMARYVGQVFAFEPNPKLFAVLRAAADPKVTCLPFGASDKNARATLMVPKNAKGFSNQGASLNPARVSGQDFGSLEVETRRIDSLDLPPVGFIKVDVEGHEIAALNGAAGLIARDKPTLIVEIEARHTGRSVADMVHEIACLGPYGVQFLYQGQWRGFDQFDQATMQPPEGPRKNQIYINNFLFLPR